MSFRRCLLLLAATGCAGGFQGEFGFVPGRAQLVPCRDVGGVESALLIIESSLECWQTFGLERPSCEQRRAALAESPNLCSPGLVVDSPSRINLTSYLGPPIDPNDYRGAGSVLVRDLPCNPAGPFAEDYPDFQEQIRTFVGEVLVTADRGTWGRVSLDLAIEGSDEPGMVGETQLQICR